VHYAIIFACAYIYIYIYIYISLSLLYIYIYMCPLFLYASLLCRSSRTHALIRYTHRGAHVSHQHDDAIRQTRVKVLDRHSPRRARSDLSHSLSLFSTPIASSVVTVSVLGDRVPNDDSQWRHYCDDTGAANTGRTPNGAPRSLARITHAHGAQRARRERSRERESGARSSDVRRRSVPRLARSWVW